MNMQAEALSSRVQQLSAEARVVLRNVSWQTFKALMADIGEDRACRIAYYQGVLEIRRPYQEIEETRVMIVSFINAYVDELSIEIANLGMLTLEREDLNCVVESDSCFYIQNEWRVRGKNINLPSDPPPDLVLESDYSSSFLNKFTVYAELGVPELWRYSRKTIQVYQLVDGKYELCDRSLAFPSLPVEEIPVLIEQSKSIGQRATARLFKEIVRKILLNSEG